MPLASNRDRFCPLHVSSNQICAIVGCSSPVVAGSLACANASHKEVERIHQEQGQARFQLKERLQRARVAHPKDAVADECHMADLIDDDNREEEYVVDECSDTSVNLLKGKKIQAQFGRRRTHNEQIIVAPCGIVLARETFYGAEGVASVVVR
jgi:hypothetical protein